MNKLKSIIVTLFMVAVPLAAVPAGTAEAVWNPFGDVCTNGNASESAACKDNRSAGGDNPLTGTDGVIMNIVNIIAFVTGAVAIIMIILAGLRFVTSGGSSDDVAGARRTIIYAAVGLVVVVMARTLVGFIIGKL